MAQQQPQRREGAHPHEGLTEYQSAPDASQIVPAVAGQHPGVRDSPCTTSSRDPCPEQTARKSVLGYLVVDAHGLKALVIDSMEGRSCG